MFDEKTWKKNDALLRHESKTITRKNVILNVRNKFLQTILVLLTKINIYKRENFRHLSYISHVSNGSICGFGANGYKIALNSIIKLINLDNNKYQEN